MFSWIDSIVKKSNCASHHYGCKHSKVPSIFVFYVAAAFQRTRNDVSRTRKASLSLAASGFSLLSWQQLPLPARVGLPVFIHFCLHAQEESQRALFTLPYMGFFFINKGHRASPIAEKISMNTSTNTYGSVQHVRACTTQHTLAHTRECPCCGFLRLSKLHPFAHNYLHLQWDGM